MLFKFVQLIFRFIQLSGDIDVLLIYPVLACIFLTTLIIFSVLANTHKQKESNTLELLNINKNIELLKTQYNQNQFSENDFQKKQQELFYDFDSLKCHWLGLNLIIKSKSQY